MVFAQTRLWRDNSSWSADRCRNLRSESTSIEGHRYCSPVVSLCQLTRCIVKLTDRATMVDARGLFFE